MSSWPPNFGKKTDNGASGRFQYAVSSTFVARQPSGRSGVESATFSWDESASMGLAQHPQPGKYQNERAARAAGWEWWASGAVCTNVLPDKSAEYMGRFQSKAALVKAAAMATGKGAMLAAQAEADGSDAVAAMVGDWTR